MKEMLVLPDTRTDAERNELYELSIALKWLCERDKQCDACINACLRVMTKNSPNMLSTLDEGHYSWMCFSCRDELDKEMDVQSKDINRAFMRAADRMAKKARTTTVLKDNVYHLCRLSFILGEEKFGWLKMVNLLRAGLEFVFPKRPDYQPAPDLLAHDDAPELFNRLRNIK